MNRTTTWLGLILYVSQYVDEVSGHIFKYYFQSKIVSSNGQLVVCVFMFVYSRNIYDISIYA